MRPRSKSMFTPDERERIVKEYENCALTASEVGQKYGISGPLLNKWRSRLHEKQERHTFAPGSATIAADSIPMREKNREELEAELEAMRKELEWARLQNKALSTMIDIAEEQGIRIRKKSGARQ